MALAYAHAVPVFPCISAEPRRKQPYTPRGFHDATCDPGVITAWWQRWPDALIGMPTGKVSGRVVFDVDVKDSRANGFDSIEDLGIVLPSTSMVHTASGGLHVYFDAGDRELKNSAGVLGAGLDVRASGGYVILPSASSGYEWDPQHNFDTVAMAPAPDWLWPPKLSRPVSIEPVRPVTGLSPYGRAAIEAACNAIASAGPGQQERTLNAESFSIGALAGAGAVPNAIALSALLRAGNRMPDHDPAWPWRPEEIDLKVRRAFSAGEAHPREARHVRRVMA